MFIVVFSGMKREQCVCMCVQWDEVRESSVVIVVFSGMKREQCVCMCVQWDKVRAVCL